MKELVQRLLRIEHDFRRRADEEDDEFWKGYFQGQADMAALAVGLIELNRLPETENA